MSIYLYRGCRLAGTENSGTHTNAVGRLGPGEVLCAVRRHEEDHPRRVLTWDDRGCEAVIVLVGRTYLVGSVYGGRRRRAGRVSIGAPDSSLTPVAGMAAVSELAGRLSWSARWTRRWGRSSSGIGGKRPGSCWSGWRRRSLPGRSSWSGWTGSASMWPGRRCGRCRGWPPRRQRGWPGGWAPGSGRRWRAVCGPGISGRPRGRRTRRSIGAGPVSRRRGAGSGCASTPVPGWRGGR